MKKLEKFTCFFNFRGILSYSVEICMYHLVNRNGDMQMTLRVMETAEINTLKSRLGSIQALDGNPMKVQTITRGSIHAFLAKNIPGPAFNTIRGINEEDLLHLDELFTHYEDQGISFRVEVTPLNGTEKVFRKLSEKGFYQSGFHCSFLGEANDVVIKESTDEIGIKRLEMDEFTLFADIYIRSFGLPAFIKEGVRQNNEVLYDVPGWEFYLASYRGEPAGISALYIEDDVATLSTAATLPEYRGLGIQSALIGKRIQSAKEKGATYIASEAAFGSGSHRNMLRAGLSLGYTKSLWTKL